MKYKYFNIDDKYLFLPVKCSGRLHRCSRSLVRSLMMCRTLSLTIPLALL